MLKRRDRSEFSAHGLRLSLQLRLRRGKAKVQLQPERLAIDGDQEDLRELVDLVVRRFAFVPVDRHQLPDESWIDLRREETELEAGWNATQGLYLAATDPEGAEWLRAFIEAYVGEETPEP